MIELRGLALLEEGRLVVAIADLAPESRRIPTAAGGGLLARGVPGTWINMAIGMGLEGPVPDSTLDDLVDWYTSVGAEPRVELCPFAHASLIDGLAARGFVIRLFENVFFRELAPGERFAPRHALQPGVVIRQLDPNSDADVGACARVIASAFADDEEPTPAAIDLTTSVMRYPRTRTLAAWCDGRIVAGGSMGLHQSVTTLFGLAVHPDYRRRGIQQALIAARLELGVERGARLATIGSRPGVSTERNARRMGFQVGYTKAAVVRPGKGLLPAKG